MRIESEKVDDILKVKPLEKRIDASVSIDFRERMTVWIREGNKRIVLNLSSVEFVDSSGLGAIISTMIALRPQGQLMVCNAKDSVLALFRLTRMDRVIPVKNDANEALRAMSGA